MYGERVDLARKLLREGFIHHAVTLDAAFAGKGCGDDKHSEMGLATRPGASVTGVKVGLVHHCQALRLEHLPKLFLNSRLDQHDVAILFRDNVAP